MLPLSIEEVNIETMNACTRRCTYCKFGLERKWQKKVMSEDVFEKILLDLKAIDYSGLIGPFVNNEPLLDKRITYFIKRISIVLPKAGSYLFTNGDLLDMALLRSLFEAGLRKIFISAHSDGRTGDFIEMLRHFGEKRVSLMKFTEVDKTEAFHNRGGSIKSDIVKQTLFPDEGCCLPFRQIVINPDGAVFLCCCDFYYDEAFDTVIRRSAVDIFLKNKKLNEIRERLARKTRRGLALCEHCSVPGYAPLLSLE